MASLKEIRTKIASVKNTQKITNAMEKVATSKMRRTQLRMQASRPYADRIRTAIGHLYQANPEYKHPYLVARDVKRVGFIVISTDRGLCGGLNVNEFRMLIREIQAWEAKGVEVELALLGSKAVQFFRNLKVNVVSQHSNVGENPLVADLITSIKIMLDAYEKGGEAGGIDRLFLLHNVFESTMSQKPAIKTLIPVEAPDADESASALGLHLRA